MTALAVVTAFLLGATPVDLPPLPLDAFQAAPAPAIEAEAYVLYDVTADLALAEQAADTQRAMASVTKLMTALVVLENAELEDEIVISEEAALTGEAEVGLVAGEVWTVWELLNAIVVRSGNDAATALAEHIGGSVEGFAALMNAKAAELGMVNSRFVNPHGLDAEGHYSSANDLLTLGRAALADPIVAELARTEAIRFRPAPNGAQRRAVNTNELLGAFDGVAGIKTGYTSQAGRVLLAVATRDGRTLMSVVMGADDHFADTRELLAYGFEMYGISDRVQALLVGEQGDGLPSLLTTNEAARLRQAPELTIADPTAPRSPTPLETRVLEALRALLPPVLTS